VSDEMLAAIKPLNPPPAMSSSLGLWMISCELQGFSLTRKFITSNKGRFTAKQAENYSVTDFK
jgi:hypothetical protein